MKQRAILIALHEIPGIGWKSIKKIIGNVNSLCELMDKGADWYVGLGIHAGVAEAAAGGLSDNRIYETCRKYENTGITAITPFDKEYPELLKETATAPWVLYAVGRVELLMIPSIAVVGTRTPTVYGRRAAYGLSRDLSGYGICIASGLARGVDGEAHKGALEGNASSGTIAVLGCGIDQIYPKEHWQLYKQIAKEGLILSEYPPGLPAHPGLFPQRNRIIAGLTLGTLVVEAAEKSGSLITADMALEESRDVFAVPGHIFSPKSVGTHWLLKQGAKLVTTADDIVSEYEHRIGLKRNTQANGIQAEAGLTMEEHKMLELISYEATPIDQLLAATETKFGHLHAILLSLLMKNMIEQLPGPAYIRK